MLLRIANSTFSSPFWLRRSSGSEIVDPTAGRGQIWFDLLCAGTEAAQRVPPKQSKRTIRRDRIASPRWIVRLRGSWFPLSMKSPASGYFPAAHHLELLSLARAG